MITIRSFARLKEIFGEERQYSLSKEITVADALHLLIQETHVPPSTIFNDMGNVHAHLIVMLNKKRLTQAALMEQVLSDGDEIILYPPVSGG